MLQGWASFFKTKSWVVELLCSLCLHSLPFLLTSLSYFSMNCSAFTWKQPKMIRNVLLPVRFWQFATFISFHSCKWTDACCSKDWSSSQILSHLFFFSRFGKHKKDDGREDRMERKGSSKSRAGDVPAVEEETQHMRLEHERWGARQCHGNTLDWNICKPAN